jgi:hypothetical protein
MSPSQPVATRPVMVAALLVLLAALTTRLMVLPLTVIMALLVSTTWQPRIRWFADIPHRDGELLAWLAGYVTEQTTDRDRSRGTGSHSASPRWPLNNLESPDSPGWFTIANPHPVGAPVDLHSALAFRSRRGKFGATARHKPRQIP